MSTRIMQAAIKAAVPDPDPTSEEYPVKIDQAVATKNAAQKLLTDSALPGWLPNVTWEIVEVYAHPFPERMVGHGNRRGAANHLLAFIVVRDSQSSNHWLHFRIIDGLPTPIVEIVHSREYHLSLEGQGIPSPGRRFDWISQFSPRTLDELNAWLAGLNALEKGTADIQARMIQRQKDQEKWVADLEALDPERNGSLTPALPVRKYTREEKEMTQAEARKAWASMPATTRQNLVAQRLSTTQQNLYNLHLAELAGEQINTEEQDKLTGAVKALQDELEAVEAELKKEAEEMNKK